MKIFKIVTSLFCLVIISHFVYAENLTLSAAKTRSLSVGNTVEIEAEDYRPGGEGVAYHDTTPENTGNTTYRTDEGVDLWNFDTDKIKVGSVRTDEWITYSYSFTDPGTYKISFMLASPNDNGSMTVTIDDKESVSILSENTGGYSSFTEVVSHSSFKVDATGTKVIKVLFTGDSVDIDKLLIKFVKAAANWSSIKDRALHVGTTDKPVKVRWDGDQSNQYYVQAWIPFYEAMADPNVTYKVFDDQNELSSFEIDQSNPEHNNRWVDIATMPVSITSGKLRVVLGVNNTNKYAAASAIRIVYGGCEPKPDGTQILGQATGTTSTGSWSDAGGNFLHKFGTGTPRKLMGAGTYTWEFNSVAAPSTTISYDIYIKHFPTNQIYAYTNTANCGVNIQLPKTGHYTFYARTLDNSAVENDPSLDGKTYAELVAMIDDSGLWSCSKFYIENNFPNGDADYLRSKMLDARMCSEWTESTDPANSMVDCQKGAWWVYGYPAPVGPIIIE